MVSVADFLGLEKKKIPLKMCNKGQGAKNADDLELG